MSLLSQLRASVFRACYREPHEEPEEHPSPFPHQAGHHLSSRGVLSCLAVWGSLQSMAVASGLAGSVALIGRQARVARAVQRAGQSARRAAMYSAKRSDPR